MQQRQKQSYSSQRIFTASEVAEFEYCPLVWWHEQFEPLTQASTEELFARLVELEHEYGPQAPTLPEYQVVEQLLLRRGAFNTDNQDHPDHGEEEIAEIAEERMSVPNANSSMRYLQVTALTILIVALILIVASLALAAR